MKNSSAVEAENIIDNRSEDNGFKRELESLINYHSQENNSNTPDFILAEYIMGCLDAFDKATNKRTKWYKQ